jgi:hypothetical protein
MFPEAGGQYYINLFHRSKYGQLGTYKVYVNNEIIMQNGTGNDYTYGSDYSYGYNSAGIDITTPPRVNPPIWQFEYTTKDNIEGSDFHLSYSHYID